METKSEKTNVMRILDGKKIAYESHTYEPDATKTGEEIALRHFNKEDAEVKLHLILAIMHM